MKLHAHQKEIIKFIQAKKRCIVVSPMGSGKTLATIEALKNCPRIAVIAPKRVAMYVWPHECKNCVFIGANVRNFEGLKTRCCMISTNFENPRLNDILKSFNPNAIVIDESSKLKGFQLRQGTKRAKLLYNATRNTEYLVLLTGTPSSENLGDLYSQVTFLDGGQCLGKSKCLFMERYYNNVSRTHKYPIWEYKEGSREKVFQCVQNVIKYFEPDIHTLPAVVNTINFDISTSTKIMYYTLKKNHVLTTKQNVLYAKNNSILGQRLLQLASGLFYGENELELCDDSRIETLKDVISEINERVVVVAFWKLSQKYILESLGDCITDSIEEFKKDGCNKHLLISPAAAAHGLSLQNQSRYMILYEPFYSCEQYAQVLERLGPRRQAQSGFNRTVYYIKLQAANTLDSTVWELLEQKKDVQSELIKLLKEG